MNWKLSPVQLITDNYIECVELWQSLRLNGPGSPSSRPPQVMLELYASAVHQPILRESSVIAVPVKGD